MAPDTDTVVYRLCPTCGLEDVEVGKTYIARVQGFANFGTFVQLNDRTKGLIHKSNVKQRHAERDQVLVNVLGIRSNGNIDLEEIILPEYRVETVPRTSAPLKISEVGQKIGRTIFIEGEVAQIKQTSGPTIFTLVDGYGTVNAAAFVEAGVRAYPEVQLGEGVAIVGEVMQRNSQLQVEVSSLSVLTGEEAESLSRQISEALDQRAEPADIPFLIESDILESLRPAMRKVAKLIRKAVYEAQPIILRHHADADGICSAVAIEQAVVSLIRESGGDFDSDYFLFRRAPSKAPFYEIEDITRDLDGALKDHARYGQKLPLILLTDNGSTEEDMPSLKIAEVYGLSVIVVDHHHPDAVVDEYLSAHVNPYHAGGDFGITAGMLGTEIARMINPSIGSNIRHLPAVAAVADRSEAPERERYLALVQENYPEDLCKDIALALDFEQFWLRFNDGRELVKDILNLNSDTVRHGKLVALLADDANAAIQEQLDATMPHVVMRELPNGARLFLLDVEIYAHKFTFPPPGKTSGEVHDQLVHKYEGEPVVTIGFGPDFAVLRSRGVMMNIPRMVRELRTEI
ncbi:MAG TPA: OB-fold nucleic acid binding domain-containing protein, partial [Methanomicrobiales archaeon]|nr:OB-fold nucleic acid binding domain-containing protein [Methanomicrobiales archaeon]